MRNADGTLNGSWFSTRLGYHSSVGDRTKPHGLRQFNIWVIWFRGYSNSAGLTVGFDDLKVSSNPDGSMN